jgi:hypothetical protein
MASPAVQAPEKKRAQLIHIETDRRLGHEWDEWDGRPLPGQGDFSAGPALFFAFAALTLAVTFGALALVLYLLAPRLGGLVPVLPGALWLTLGAAAVVTWLWFALAVTSHYIRSTCSPSACSSGGRSCD